MGVLKFTGKFFGWLFIFLALMVVFTGLFVQYSLENIDVLAKSAETKLPKIMQENKEVFAEALLKEESIKKAQLTELCLEDPDQLSEDFCTKLKAMSEEEMNAELVDVMISKVQEGFEPQIQEFEQNIKSQLGHVLEYLKYVIPFGIVIFLLGSLIVLLVEKFKWKNALFHISMKTGSMSALVAIGNYLMKNMTSEKFESLARTLPTAQGEQAPSLAIKLMSGLLTDWIKLVSAKLFLVSITIAVASLSMGVITFIFKRKRKVKPKKVKAIKKPEEEKAPKKKEKPKKPKKKKSKKVLFSRKKK